MIGIFYEPITAEKAIVRTRIFDLSILTASDKAVNYIEVEEIPEAEKLPMKSAITYINPTTKQIWIEYIDRPLTKEEELEKKIATLETENANISYVLMMEGIL